MRTRTTRTALGLAVGMLLAAALVWIGRETVRPSATINEAVRRDAYFAGLRAGEAQGRQEGRALQEGASLPSSSRQPVTDAFNAGYAAGQNDAFAGYDGGWAYSTPYLVTLERGSGQIAYRISSRIPITANVDYYLCGDGHNICQGPRR